MNRLIIPALVALLVSGPAWGETYFDLVQREGLYYKKSTEVPFSGTVTGRYQGKIKNGKRDGPWFRYHENGQLRFKGTFKNAKRVGPWVWYYNNGQLWSKGTYKNGRREGPWVINHNDGTVVKFLTGTYKDGKKVK